MHGGPTRRTKLRPKSGYFRTVIGNLYRAVGFESLAAIERHIDSKDFVLIHRYVLLNVRHVVKLNPKPNLMEVGVRHKEDIDTLPVSRRHVPDLFDRLGIRRGSEPARATDVDLTPATSR